MFPLELAIKRVLKINQGLERIYSNLDEFNYEFHEGLKDSDPWRYEEELEMHENHINDSKIEYILKTALEKKIKHEILDFLGIKKDECSVFYSVTKRVGLAVPRNKISKKRIKELSDNVKAKKFDIEPYSGNRNCLISFGF